MNEAQRAKNQAAAELVNATGSMSRVRGDTTIACGVCKRKLPPAVIEAHELNCRRAAEGLH